MKGRWVVSVRVCLEGEAQKGQAWLLLAEPQGKQNALNTREVAEPKPGVLEHA